MTGITDDRYPQVQSRPSWAAVSLVAPIWRRIVAYALDYILIFCYLCLLGVLAFLVPAVRAWFRAPKTAHLAAFVLLTIPVSGYFILSEASSAGATFGKRFMGILVRGGDGQRLGMARSVLRTCVKFIPWELSHAALWRIQFRVDHPTAIALLVATWTLVIANIVSVALDRRRRTIYDFAARSKVVLAVCDKAA